MSLDKPSDVRRSFAKGSGMKRTKSMATPNLSNPRLHRTNHWPAKKLDYAQLETFKEVFCRIKHPTGYYKRKYDLEYRLSIMPWSRGVYLDLRQYRNGNPTAVGLLLHLDIMLVLLPELIAAVRKAEEMDTREPDKKAKPEVILS